MGDDLISREALKKSMRKSINERYISWTKTITVADIATLIFDEIEYAPTVEPEQITIKCDTEEDKQKLLSAFRNAKLKVLNEAEITQGEWIPIGVQEPDVGGIYLVTAKHVSGHIGTDIARRISDDIWTFGGEELSGTEIIAWRPLPEPYKEEEK